MLHFVVRKTYIFATQFPTTGDGAVLPRMPEKPVKNCLIQYGPDIQLKLFPHERNKISRVEEASGVDLRITQPLDIGYGKKQQTVIATVQSGRKEIREKTVLLKFFNTTSISPDQLQLIPHHSTFPDISPRSKYVVYPWVTSAVQGAGTPDSSQTTAITARTGETTGREEHKWDLSSSKPRGRQKSNNKSIDPTLEVETEDNRDRNGKILLQPFENPEAGNLHRPLASQGRFKIQHPCRSWWRSHHR